MQPRRKSRISAPVVAGAPRPAPGVAYFELPAAEGLRFFRCEAYSASLSDRGCSGRWIEAQAAKGERADRYSACRGCAIGAAHAGHEVVTYSTYYDIEVCPRCGKGGMRMIGGARCVSCYNREREIATGKNARGNAPVELMREKSYRAVHLTLVVDGVPRPIVTARAVSVVEPIIQAMRTTKGGLAFAFSRGVDALNQGARL
jgi:hypothetical protein